MGFWFGANDYIFTSNPNATHQWAAQRADGCLRARGDDLFYFSHIVIRMQLLRMKRVLIEIGA